MPAPKDYDLGHIQKLKDIGIEILEEYKGAKQHHDMKCIACGYLYNATPVSKIRNHKLYPHSNGCPKCNIERKGIKHKDVRERNLNKLKTANITVLTPDYNGKRGSVYAKIRVRNNNCGHEFDLCVANFLHRKLDSICIICGVKQRSEALTALAKIEHDKWMETASEWQAYKYEVVHHTEKNYIKHKETVNPLQHPRGIAGTMGAYQLDHIISKRYCFDNNIPTEVCSHPHNLRMIPWYENIAKGMHIIDWTIIPKIFEKYIQETSIVDWDHDSNEKEDSICAEIIELTQKQMLL